MYANFFWKSGKRERIEKDSYEDFLLGQSFIKNYDRKKKDKICWNSHHWQCKQRNECGWNYHIRQDVCVDLCKHLFQGMCEEGNTCYVWSVIL